MTDLFGHPTNLPGRQLELFERGGRVSAADCPHCGRPLERTPSGYETCAHGCMKLMPPAGEACGSWFADDLTGEL